MNHSTKIYKAKDRYHPPLSAGRHVGSLFTSGRSVGTPLGKLPRVQVQFKHTVNLRRGATLHLRDPKPSGDEAQEAEASEYVTHHGAQVAGIRVIDIRQAQTETGTEGRRKEPADTLGLGTEVQGRNLGAHSVGRRPGREAGASGNDDENDGAKPGDRHVAGDAASDTHAEPEEAADSEADEGEKAMAKAADGPHADDVGDEADEDADNEQHETHGSRDTDDLAKVACLREERETEHLRQHTGEEDDSRSANVRLGEAGGKAGVGLTTLVFDIALDDGESVVGVDATAGKSTLGTASLFGKAHADEVNGTLGDDEGEDTSDDGKNPLRGKGDGVAVFGVDEAVDDERTDKLAHKGEDGEEGEEGATQLGRHNLGDVGLAGGHHHAEGKTL